MKAASHVRSDDTIVQSKQAKISGIDTATIAHFYSCNWTTGSERTLGQLGTDGALVPKSYAAEKHLKVGSAVSLKSPKGQTDSVVVRGIHEPPTAHPLLADVVVTQTAFDSAYSQPSRVSEGRHQAHGDGPGDALRAAGLLDRREPVRHGQHDGALGVRAHREIGMLRTIGMTRRQARRMIRHESIITALMGAALGIGPGLFLTPTRRASRLNVLDSLQYE